MRYVFFLTAIIGIVASCSATNIRAQSRDYFTDQEVELVRDAQDIDLRILVLTHVIDRRFAALKINVGAASINPKDSEKWGPLQEGSRFELFDDIRHVLQKAIDDIEDTAAHAGTKMERQIENPDRSKKDKAGPPPFARAVRALAAAAERYKPALNTELSNTKDQKEKGAILESLDFCEQIIAAAAKPMPTAKPAETQVKSP